MSPSAGGALLIAWDPQCYGSEFSSPPHQSARSRSLALLVPPRWILQFYHLYHFPSPLTSTVGIGRKFYNPIVNHIVNRILKIRAKGSQSLSSGPRGHAVLPCPSMP
jgi:hypothetical protein